MQREGVARIAVILNRHSRLSLNSAAIGPIGSKLYVGCKWHLSVDPRLLQEASLRTCFPVEFWLSIMHLFSHGDSFPHHHRAEGTAA